MPRKLKVLAAILGTILGFCIVAMLYLALKAGEGSPQLGVKLLAATGLTLVAMVMVPRPLPQQ